MAQDSWISVKDKLPDVDLKVIVYDSDHGIDTASFYKTNELGENYFDNDGWFEYSISVTHWMPLPKPPTQ